MLSLRQMAFYRDVATECARKKPSWTALSLDKAIHHRLTLYKIGWIDIHSNVKGLSNVELGESNT